MRPSLTAVLGALAVGLAVMMGKAMPKLMANMMPSMEDAGVQPPCAQIILERMD